MALAFDLADLLGDFQSTLAENNNDTDAALTQFQIENSEELQNLDLDGWNQLASTIGKDGNWAQERFDAWTTDPSGTLAALQDAQDTQDTTSETSAISSDEEEEE